jgi:hypothetical protein
LLQFTLHKEVPHRNSLQLRIALIMGRDYTDKLGQINLAIHQFIKLMETLGIFVFLDVIFIVISRSFLQVLLQFSKLIGCLVLIKALYRDFPLSLVHLSHFESQFA